MAMFLSRQEAHYSKVAVAFPVWKKKTIRRPSAGNPHYMTALYFSHHRHWTLFSVKWIVSLLRLWLLSISEKIILLFQCKGKTRDPLAAIRIGESILSNNLHVKSLSPLIFQSTALSPTHRAVNRTLSPKEQRTQWIWIKAELLASCSSKHCVN